MSSGGSSGSGSGSGGYGPGLSPRVNRSPRSPSSTRLLYPSSRPDSPSKEWPKTFLASGIYTRSRVIAAFVGLTLLYTIALIALCSRDRPADGAGSGLSSEQQLEAGAAAAALEQLRQAHAANRLQQLKCRACPECPAVPEQPEPVTCPECKQEPPVICPAPMPCPAATECPPAPVCPSCPAPAAVTAVPVPAPAQPPSLATFTTTNLLTDPSSPQAHPLDSTGTVFTISGRGASGRRGDQYKLCSFTRVCAQNGRLMFAAHDAAQAAQWSAEWTEKCWKVPQWEQPAICSCFHGKFLPSFLTPEQMAVAEATEGAYRPQHFWSMHKWVNVHHIAHWAQKLVLFQSVFQHSAGVPVPALDGLLFHDSDPPLSDHEQVILDAALAALPAAEQHPLARREGREGRLLWAGTLAAQQAAMEAAHAAQIAAGQPIATAGDQLTCFARLSLTPHYGIFATHPDDTTAFRAQVYAQLGLPPPQRCPPRRAVLLYRHNRGIVNRDEVRALVAGEFGVDLEFQTVNGRSSSREQVSLFASAGLVLSSHSSQLVNVLFSPPGGAVVEIAPEFYNADFAEYAHGVGVFFQYALGGEVPGGKDQPDQRDCVARLAHCDGASFCVLERRHECNNREFPNKNMDFVANLTAVRIAVKNSIQHLNWLCGGRW